MEQIILIVHVLTALGIVGLIMIQQGKGADMGASFGAGASQTLFGSGGSGNALTQATTLLVTLFFVTSFGLAVVAKNKAGAAGLLDIPVPAVVEQRSPAAADDGLGADYDVPEGIDNIEVPVADQPVESTSDIPEL